MDIGFLSLEGDTPLYVQIYKGFKSAIEQQQLQAKEKLPSIRSLAHSLSVSNITVEKAYDQLYSEGYIEKNNRARHTVATISFPPWKESPQIQATQSLENSLAPLKKEYRYNLAAGDMDPNGFNFELWRRFVSRSLSHGEELMSYGDIQGEKELREEIAQYLFRSRGVTASPSQIVVGANTQVLLGILCSLLDRENDMVAFEDPGFKHGRQVFDDYGFSIQPIPMENSGIDVQRLEESNANIAYISPSHQFPTGKVLPIGLRTQLLHWANKKNHLLIEDDYDSEFRYYGNPIPALKGLDRRDTVVYLGSFSKILPPSIRISYMLLPLPLMEKFLAKQSRFNQSASSIEQLALAYFMQEGELERQIRRLRKQYQEKREVFLALLDKYFGESLSVYKNHSGLFVVLEVHNNMSSEALKATAAAQGCLVRAISDYAMNPTEDNRLLLYFSGLPLEDLENVVQRLHTAWIN